MLFLILLPFYSTAQHNTAPIGLWQEHLPYGTAIDVTASAKKIYAATPYSIFSIDESTGEIDRLSKTTGLTETGISTIRFDKRTERLYIAYSNSNIDIVDGKGLHNIADLKREAIAGDKNIYHFFPDKDLCYLSTGFGVVVLNVAKNEIKDSWLIGNGGAFVRTNMLGKDDNNFYAATNDGLKTLPLTALNPADYRQWQTVSGSNGLPAGPSKAVLQAGGKIIAEATNALYLWSGNTWNLLFSNGMPITSVNESEGKIVITQHDTNGNAQLVLLDVNGVVETIIPKGFPLEVPSKAILQNGKIWLADAYHALSQWNGNQLLQHFEPNSPEDIATGELIVYKNKLVASAGTVDANWNYQYNASGLFRFEAGRWTNYNRSTVSTLDSVLDIITAAIDPRDETIWAGSFGGGLIHFGNPVKIYKQNSPLAPAVGDPLSYRVAGLAFDAQHNLWVSNYGAPRYLHVLKKDGTWQSFTTPFSLVENAVGQILIDDYDQKWIVAPKANGLIVYHSGASLENTGDDKWRLFSSGAGAGNLPSPDVLSIAKDKNGFIWVGTSDGLAVIECVADAATNNCNAVRPVAQNGPFAAYLFKGEEVRSIAVDGADRKWIATSNGAWLISANGEKIIEHYTEGNSPLLSNDVKRIAINGSTGEVFFATAKGICSLRGTATEGVEKTENLLVYPNPVPPGYNGTIAIKGLAANSLVKITELNGRLVHQTRALGGQAIWNGRDYKDRRISSGIYLVLVTTENFTDKAMGKIVFIAQ